MRNGSVDPGLILLCAILSLAGACMGTFTGIVPGIHVNTLASVLLATYPAIESALSPVAGPYEAAVAVCCCIMSASVTHSFLDFVPSVFIGAPDSEDCMSVLPGHRLLLEGRGMEAVRAAAIGSLVGTSAAILLSVPMQYAMTWGMEGVLDRMTPYVVIGAAVILIMTQFRKGSGVAGLICFLLSGAVGLAVMYLPIPSDGIAGEGTLMFPMLSGLFGIPVLLAAEEGKVPSQKECYKDPEVACAGLRGVVMGCVAGWFPGITSTVGASISACFMPENRPERFIAAVASIGSVTAVLSLVTLSISGSGRSGTVLVIGEIAGESVSGVASEAFLLLLMAAALGSLGGYLLTIKAGEVFSVLAERVDQKRLSRWVLALTIVLVIVLTGPFGLMMLFVSTLVGFLPGAFGTDRTILSGCLLLPVILMQFRSEPGRSLGHELRVVHHETLVGPGADLPRSVPDDGLEDQPPPVDLDELRLAHDLRPYGRGSGMGYVQTGPDGALAICQRRRHALGGRSLDEGDHRRGGENRERTAAHGFCGVLLRHLDGLAALDACLEHVQYKDGGVYDACRPLGGCPRRFPCSETVRKSLAILENALSDTPFLDSNMEPR